MTAKSDRAKELMKDPILKEAFNTVRERYRDLIESTPISSGEYEALLDIRKMLHLLVEVEKHLQNVVRDGHLEDFRANQQENESWQRKH